MTITLNAVKPKSGSDVTFLSQAEPVDEYGRALYAVGRSVLRALLDQLGPEDLTDLNTDRADITFRQLSKVVRLQRDKGMRGDGFEWAVHEAIVGGEPLVCRPIVDALESASATLRNRIDKPSSLLFGYERAKYLGFLDAVVEAGADSYILPDGSGRPFQFGPWVSVAAQGKMAEPFLRPRIKEIWKTDIFLSNQDETRYVAASIKSNWRQLEQARGIRIGIVPEASDLRPGRYGPHKGMHLAVLPDPDGFMGLFNDAYQAVARAVAAVGLQDAGHYFEKPSAKAQRLQAQLEKYESAKVVDLEDALNEAAQERLVAVETQLVSVDAPDWLHLTERSTKVIAPKPTFERLD